MGSSRVVARTLEVIPEFDPKYWVMESPQTGRLKRQQVVAQLAFDDVGYCKSGFSLQKADKAMGQH